MVIKVAVGSVGLSLTLRHFRQKGPKGLTQYPAPTPLSLHSRLVSTTSPNNTKINPENLSKISKRYFYSSLKKNEIPLFLLNPHAPDRFTPSRARCAKSCGAVNTHR